VYDCTGANATPSNIKAHFLVFLPSLQLFWVLPYVAIQINVSIIVVIELALIECGYIENSSIIAVQ
jgi:hypothetical protein